MEPRKGVEFTHDKMIDTRTMTVTREGTVYARMKITSVRGGRVFYTYAWDDRPIGAFTLPVDKWIERFGDRA